MLPSHHATSCLLSSSSPPPLLLLSSIRAPSPPLLAHPPASLASPRPRIQPRRLAVGGGETAAPCFFRRSDRKRATWTREKVLRGAERESSARASSERQALRHRGGATGARGTGRLPHPDRRVRNGVHGEASMAEERKKLGSRSYPQEATQEDIGGMSTRSHHSPQGGAPRLPESKSEPNNTLRASWEKKNIYI